MSLALRHVEAHALHPDVEDLRSLEPGFDPAAHAWQARGGRFGAGPGRRKEPSLRT